VTKRIIDSSVGRFRAANRHFKQAINIAEHHGLKAPVAGGLPRQIHPTILLEVREIGVELQATVLFDVIMREDSNAQPDQVREVWHFVKPKNSIQPTWYLDGIQQLED
jgi:hypothetical protein